mmetsp:Transcript_6506/g.19464  ORF Transcript_6506/g.19464 Transcript_6506/m.19464 type:complete len:232 (+) Transcript_6506:952-1647(+)
MAAESSSACVSPGCKCRISPALASSASIVEAAVQTSNTALRSTLSSFPTGSFAAMASQPAAADAAPPPTPDASPIGAPAASPSPAAAPPAASPAASSTNSRTGAMSATSSTSSRGAAASAAVKASSFSRAGSDRSSEVIADVARDTGTVAFSPSPTRVGAIGAASHKDGTRPSTLRLTASSCGSFTMPQSSPRRRTLLCVLHEASTPLTMLASAASASLWAPCCSVAHCQT